MYTKNFNLNKLPFENVPDPAFFFDQGDYAHIRNRIKNSMIADRGLIVVTGPIGSGKTTLSQMIKSDYSDDLQLIWMAEPPDNSKNLFLFVIQELGLKTLTTERVFVLRAIREALVKINSAGKKCLMIIDESHRMDKNLLEGIRILNNLEEGPTKLLQVLLLGQVEILESINKPEMEPFKQRISSMEIIGKLNADNIQKYISHRIKMAGGLPSIFTETGWKSVIIASRTGGGIPRVINSLCDRSLNAAFKKGKTAVDMDDVCETAEEMGMAKDIFHYKMAIKKKILMEELTLMSDMLETAPKDPTVYDSFVASKSAITTAEKLKKSKQEIIQEEKPDDLKAPLQLLLTSIAALALSIAFYYQRL